MSGTVFCTAKSKVRVYDDALLDTLNSKQTGIGQLLKSRGLNPEFTLHDAGRRADGGVWRFYRLACSGLVEFDIMEDFSPDIFLP